MIYFDMEFNSSMPQSNTTNDIISEIVQLQNKLSSSNAPVELKEGSMRAIQRLERMAKWGNYSSEFEGVDKYIDWITRVPWGVVSEDNLDIQNARQLLDSTHYGMDTVKEMILDYLATMQLKKITKNRGIGNQDGNTPTIPTLLFVGLQGIGKTTIAQSIASKNSKRSTKA